MTESRDHEHIATTQSHHRSVTANVPFLPSEVINLIIAHYIGPYTLRITYAWWDFDSNIRIHNIPPTDSLALVSRTFNNIVRRQLRLAFTGCLKIDHDAAENMQHYQRSDGGTTIGKGTGPITVRADGSLNGSSTSNSSPSSSSTSLDSASTHLNWLFNNIHTVRIAGYPPNLSRPYIVDMGHWPALERVEILLRVSLLPYLREITTEQHDEEVLKIAGKIAGNLKVEGLREGGKVDVGLVFESCRCGLFCLVRAREGKSMRDDGALEILHSEETWLNGSVKEVNGTDT